MTNENMFGNGSLNNNLLYVFNSENEFANLEFYNLITSLEDGCITFVEFVNKLHILVFDEVLNSFNKINTEDDFYKMSRIANNWHYQLVTNYIGWQIV